MPVEVSRERLELHPADGVGGASLGPANEYSIAPRGVREEMVSLRTLLCTLVCDI